MGTTLTGTTPQDTYDALIKVGDNGPISGTAKFLSDGLGNDSVLALSTARVGIGTNTPSTNLDVAGEIKLSSDLYMGNNRFLRFERSSGSTSIQTLGIPTGTDDVRLLTTGDFNVLSGGLASLLAVKSTGNVGIGTSTPSAKLDVTKAGKATIMALDTTAFAAGVGGSLDLGGNYRAAGDFQAFTRIAAEKTNATDNNFSYDLGFYVTTNGGSTQGTKVATMTSAGVLDLTAGQIKFPATQVASADANTLDDYEEGTWTPTSNSAGYTISAASGSYTKIGRQVVIRGDVEFSAVNAASTSLFGFLGLPFTPDQSYQGICREDTATGAVFIAQARTTPDGILNSMDGITTASQQAFVISRTYRFTVTYFV